MASTTKPIGRTSKRYLGICARRPNSLYIQLNLLKVAVAFDLHWSFWRNYPIVEVYDVPLTHELWSCARLLTLIVIQSKLLKLLYFAALRHCWCYVDLRRRHSSSKFHSTSLSSQHSAWKGGLASGPHTHHGFETKIFIGLKGAKLTRNNVLSWSWCRCIEIKVDLLKQLLLAGVFLLTSAFCEESRVVVVVHLTFLDCNDLFHTRVLHSGQ